MEDLFTLIVGIVVLIVIFAVIASAITKRRRKGPPSLASASTSQEEPTPKTEIRLTLEASSPGETALPPQPVRTPDGGWLVNPSYPFSITIYAIGEEDVKRVRELLDSSVSTRGYQEELLLSPIVARTNLHCKEIDEYVRQFKPQYLQKIEELKQAHADEWNASGEKDKEDLLTTFRDEALATLDVAPDCDLKTLFECEPRDFTIDDVLIDRFGYENMVVYLRYLARVGDVLSIPADYRDRPIFERLVEAGLAIRGTDIPLEVVLSSLTLKQMTALVTDLNPPKFTRKAKAIEFLQGVPDLRERLQKQVAFRELFQLKPLPSDLKHIHLEQVSATWRYAGEVALLLVRTYVASVDAARSYSKRADSPYVRGWEISTVNPCPHCRQKAGQTYPRNNPPDLPFHIGCKCVAFAKHRD